MVRDIIENEVPVSPTCDFEQTVLVQRVAGKADAKYNRPDISSIDSLDFLQAGLIMNEVMNEEISAQNWRIVAAV